MRFYDPTPFLHPFPHPYPIARPGAASDGSPVAKIRRAATNADIVQFTTAPLGGWSSIHEQLMHVPITLWLFNIAMENHHF